MNGYRSCSRKGTGVQKPAYNPASAVILRVVERINIVGAGIIGLGCAWRLAQRGVNVLAIDARDAGREASWAAAGMLAPGGEFFGPSALATLALRSLDMYGDFIRELEEESGVTIDFRRSGAIEVAYSEEEACALEVRTAAQATCGIPSEACTHEGRPARFFPDDAMVDPRDLTRALRRACQRRGVSLLEDEQVTKISADGRVWTANGVHAGSITLVTAGAWSSQLLAELPGNFPPVVPVRGHLVAWHLRPGLLEPILRHGSTYLLQRRSGVLLAGATKEYVGFDRTLDEAAVASLQACAGELLPTLAGQVPTERWNGLRPFVDGEMPFVGQLGESSVWAAYGHYRNGILLAPETISRVAAQICA